MATFSNVKFSLLELASAPSNTSVRDTLLELRRYAQAADDLGFTRLWLAEHHNMEGICSSATSVLIADLAAHTQRIRIGSGGIMLPNHPPLVVAEQFGTLEALHPGRIDLGLGRAPGTDPMTSRALYRNERRADNFPQEVQELQRLLGECNEPGVRAYPGRNSKVPIWILGSSLFSAQLAAHLGLPYSFAGHFAPALAQEALHLYRQNFQPSDVLAGPYSMLCVPLILADSDEEAKYLGTSSQQRILALIQGQPLYLPPPVDSMESLWDSTSKLHVQNFLALSIVGGPQTVAFKMQSLLQSYPCDELMFTNDIYDREKRIHALELLKQLQQ